MRPNTSPPRSRRGRRTEGFTPPPRKTGPGPAAASALGEARGQNAPLRGGGAEGGQRGEREGPWPGHPDDGGGGGGPPAARAGDRPPPPPRRRREGGDGGNPRQGPPPRQSAGGG